MRLRTITTIVLAGATLAACGSKASNTVNSLGSPSSTTSGLNTSKTAFVLPHGLGTLPASELALAKTDHAYAAGLLNPADWIDIRPTAHTKPYQQGWFYVGGMTGSSMSAVISAKVIAASIASAASNLAPANESITASQLDTFPVNSTHFFQSINTHGYSLLAPSVLEVRAAPTGTLTVGGTPLGAMCVPSSVAIMHGKSVVSLKGISTITAGPSTIFAFTTSSSKPGVPTLYDQGTSSCFSFR